MGRARRAIGFSLRLVLALAMGVALAAGLAWGIVLLEPKDRANSRSARVLSAPDGTPYYIESVKSGIGWACWDVSQASRNNLQYPRRIPGWITLPGPAPIVESRTTAWGWPLLCMSYLDQRVRGSGGFFELDSWTWTRGVQGAANYRSYRFPTTVLAWRFGADAALFACVVWFAIAGRGVVRAWVRRRRGRCAACGYDREGLAGGAPCPECGAGARALAVG